MNFYNIKRMELQFMRIKYTICKIKIISFSSVNLSNHEISKLQCNEFYWYIISPIQFVIWLFVIVICVNVYLYIRYWYMYFIGKRMSIQYFGWYHYLLFVLWIDLYVFILIHMLIVQSLIPSAICIVTVIPVHCFCAMLYMRPP